MAIYIKKLDAIRGFTAFYILLTHFVLVINFIPKPIKIFFDFGQEAVVVFFVLSGFVIYLSIYRQPHLTFKSYFTKRFSRIYFPLFVSIFISIIIVYFSGSLREEFSWTEFTGNLLMLQDFAEVKPGVWFKPLLHNLPLWSLGYEWWFYMMFYPIYKFSRKLPGKIYFILAFCLLSYINYITIPNHASLVFSYFIIWWSGVEAAAVFTQQGQFTYKNMSPVLFSLFLMSVITAIPAFSISEIRLGYYPFLIFRHFLDAYVLMVIGIFWYQRGLVNFDKIFGLFSKLAPISYPLYLLQYPIITRWNANNYIDEIGLCILKFTLIITLSYWIGIKLQPMLNQSIK